VQLDEKERDLPTHQGNNIGQDAACLYFPNCLGARAKTHQSDTPSTPTNNMHSALRRSTFFSRSASSQLPLRRFFGSGKIFLYARAFLLRS